MEEFDNWLNRKASVRLMVNKKKIRSVNGEMYHREKE